MKPQSLAVSAALILSACASTTTVMPVIETVDRPALNTVSEAELGDTIVEKGKVSTYEGLQLRNELSWGDGLIMKKFNIPPGRLKAQQRDANFTYFPSDKMTSYDVLLGTSPWPGGVCTKNGDPTFVRTFITIGRCTIKPSDAPQIARTRIVDLDAPNFRQELIYNGRSGQTVKFLYREASGDYARPAFSQDVQYDLNDGNVIGFKGARIEIVEATNTRLKYRVLSSFPAN